MSTKIKEPCDIKNADDIPQPESDTYVRLTEKIMQLTESELDEVISRVNELLNQ